MSLDDLINPNFSKISRISISKPAENTTLPSEKRISEGNANANRANRAKTQRTVANCSRSVASDEKPEARINTGPETNCSTNSKNSRGGGATDTHQGENAPQKDGPHAIPAIPATTRETPRDTGASADTNCSRALLQFATTQPSRGKRLPPSLAWQFVCLTPFTRAMVLDAAGRWGEPLCPGDIKDIERGKHLYEASDNYLRDYLRAWAADHPEQMHELKSAHCDPAQLPRAAIETCDEAPAKGQPNFWFTEEGRASWLKHKRARKPKH